jgi:hypothetical protein
VADCETYAYAALLLGPVPVLSLAAEVDRVNTNGPRPTPAVPTSDKPTPAPAKPSTGWMPRRPSGWMR